VRGRCWDHQRHRDEAEFYRSTRAPVSHGDRRPNAIPVEWGTWLDRAKSHGSQAAARGTSRPVRVSPDVRYHFVTDLSAPCEILCFKGSSCRRFLLHSLLRRPPLPGHVAPRDGPARPGRPHPPLRSRRHPGTSWSRGSTPMSLADPRPKRPPTALPHSRTCNDRGRKRHGCGA
jgi:hypothetical protein